MNRIVPIAQPKQTMARTSQDFIDALMDEYLDDRVFAPARRCQPVTRSTHQCSLLDHLEGVLDREADPHELILS